MAPIRLVPLFLVASGPFLAAADCNRNGRDDARDLLQGSSGDCNGNSVPDECDLKPLHQGFEQGERFLLGSWPVRLQVADLDGNGWVDVLTWDGQTIEVILNRGGAFDPPAAYRSSWSSYLAWTLVDLDRDGRLDPVVADGERLHVLRMRADGSLEPPALAARAPSLVTSLVSADLNGDGAADLAAASAGYQTQVEMEESSVAVFLHDGQRAFLLPREIAVPATALASGDLDGDGDQDLAALEWGAYVRLLLNRGDGSFQLARYANVGASYIAPLDLAGDGRTDLALHDSYASLWILRNTREGLLASTRSYTLGTQVPGPVDLAAADLDRDGLTDLAICRGGSADLLLFWGREDGSLAGPQRFLVGPRMVSLGAADLDRDGDPDLALAQQGLDGAVGSVSLLSNRTAPPQSEDRDGDGFPDECGRAFHRGDPSGDGTLDLADPLLLLGRLFLGGDAPRCLDAADVNDDGLLDVADPVSLLNHLFLGGIAPPAPGPPGRPCGVDLGSHLGCVFYSGC